MRLMIFLVLPMALLLSSCSPDKKIEPTKSAPVSVKIGKVRQVRDLETITVSGTVASPNAPANVSFLISGKVILVGPREGEYVKKGQLLARIDPTDYALAEKSAIAQANMAKAVLLKTKNAVRPEQLEQARIAYERADDEYQRMKMLYDSKSLAPNDYRKFKAAWESARQQYEQAQAGGQKEDEAQTQASYDQAVANLQITRKRLGDATLYAPINGYVAKRSIEPGEMATPGRPAFEIVQLDPVEISVGVPETDIPLVKIGQKAEIKIPALPGETFSGTVRVINVSADPSTRTYMTRITVANPRHILRVGMVAEACIRGDRIINISTLPAEAIMRDPQGVMVVFVYYPDQQRVYAKRVEVGSVHDKDVEIRSGLTGNESIVVAGQERLRDGINVSATAAAPPALAPVGAPERKERR